MEKGNKKGVGGGSNEKASSKATKQNAQDFKRSDFMTGRLFKRAS